MSSVATLAKKLDTQSMHCVRIVQWTDSHIFSEEKGKLLGLDTRHSFEAVLGRISKEELAPDFFLATGDLSQDASEESYRYIASKIGSLEKPTFWIPGNHDSPELMATTLKGDSIYPHKRILAGNWQIVLLDTSVPKKVYGNLSDDDLSLVEEAVSEYPELHLLVVMHHQPVNVGSNWLDNLGIKNAEELFKRVKSHENKVCFLWGHVHQDFNGESQGVQLISTPSTCVQFRPGSKDFSAGDESPGYRYLTLHEDGRVESLLHRIDDIEFTVDYSIKGY
ncbi:3',5'-cyclic-AMP phosphodiesterase [Pleionea sediminis]|uniref:3',5'-cyclic-AMP phosphodiesterase n=1 Tax=Pleionea sediminis TaxID=2569479 RepID=UPI0011865CD0|nr:3',5'-cyclic-AMP phosphodiesterase [Pleionea sediminis]